MSENDLPYQHHYTPQTHQPRRPLENDDDMLMKSIRCEAPTFEGTLNPNDYLEWEAAMDNYFQWYDLSEERKVRFARMKLTKQARLSLNTIEANLRLRGDPPITTWIDLKRLLRDKYVPLTYKSHLLDQWQRLTQGTKSVSDYISRFDELNLRCGMQEDPAMTLSRFRAGLREDIQRELFLRNVTTLQEAYRLSSEIERLQRILPIRRTEPSYKPTLKSPSPGTPTSRPQANPTPKPLPRLNGPEVTCYKCKGLGHVAAQCPNRRINYLECEKNPEEELTDDYNPNDDLAKEYYEDEGEDYIEESELISVVRCTFTQPKKSED